MLSLLLAVNLFINPETPHPVPAPGALQQLQFAGEDELLAPDAYSMGCSFNDFAECMAGCIDSERPGYMTYRAVCWYQYYGRGAKLSRCDCYYEWVGVNPRHDLVTDNFGRQR